jgi:tungstate transport system ATP-binding protein
MDIHIKNLVKSYNGKNVLQIDELIFKEGLAYAVLGLNGSGKSTLIKCIAGLESLSSGKITYGKVIDAATVRLNLSMVAQKPYMFDTTVKDNILMGLKYRKLSSTICEKRIYKYLNIFEMENLLSANAKKISGGEAARTALLRAAVLETEVTLLDEPTASMDIDNTFRAEKLIRTFSGGKRTLIMVTHDLYQAERLADYIIFMDKARIIEEGSKVKVLRNPENPVVRSILNMK